MSEEKKKRNSYADLGLVIAVTIIIVMILRCLMFGITWEDIFWIVLSSAYCAISYKFDSESKVIKHSTTAFLLLSVIATAAIVVIDRKPQPKMHAFEGAKEDTIAEEQFIQKEEPVLPELEKDTEVVIDSIEPTPSVETPAEVVEEPESLEQEESTQE